MSEAPNKTPLTITPASTLAYGQQELTDDERARLSAELTKHNQQSERSPQTFSAELVSIERLTRAHKALTLVRGFASPLGTDALLTLHPLLFVNDLSKLKALGELLQTTGWAPNAPELLRVWKPDGGRRLLSRLSYLDALVYQLLADALSEALYETYQAHKKTDKERRFKVLSNHLNAAQDTEERGRNQGFLFRDYHPLWSTLQELPAQHGAPGDALLKLDIMSFFERIQHALLCDQLKRLGVNDELLEPLRSLLSVFGEGLPCDYTPSHLLAELYLQPLDELLDRLSQRSGVKAILRYVDDLSVLTTSEREAREMIPLVSATLSSLGIALQPYKMSLTTLPSAPKLTFERPLELADELLALVLTHPPSLVGERISAHPSMLMYTQAQLSKASASLDLAAEELAMSALELKHPSLWEQLTQERAAYEAEVDVITPKVEPERALSLLLKATPKGSMSGAEDLLLAQKFMRLLSASLYAKAHLLKRQGSPYGSEEPRDDLKELVYWGLRADQDYKGFLNRQANYTLKAAFAISQRLKSTELEQAQMSGLQRVYELYEALTFEDLYTKLSRRHREAALKLKSFDEPALLPCPRLADQLLLHAQRGLHPSLTALRLTWLSFHVMYHHPHVTARALKLAQLSELMVTHPQELIEALPKLARALTPHPDHRALLYSFLVKDSEGLPHKPWREQLKALTQALLEVEASASPNPRSALIERRLNRLLSLAESLADSPASR